MLIPCFIALMNLIGMFIMWYDKSQAIAGSRRVPEKRIFLIGFLGGAIGVWLGMNLFRHKTKHALFVAGIPILVVINIFLFVLLALKV